MLGPDHSAIHCGSEISRQDIVSLQESERCFRAIASWTYDWESWHDQSNRLVWVNHAVSRFTGYTVEECLAMEDYPLPMVAESDRSKIREILQTAAKGLPGNDVEFRILNRTGAELWGAISWQAIADDHGADMGYRTSVRDISDRKKMEQQIRHYAENLEQLVEERTARLMELEERRAKVDRLAALGQLAAGVAHEINNPLAGIRNTIELIAERLPLEGEELSLIEMVQSEIDRMAGIVRQLYQLHRPQPETARPINLMRLSEETIQLLSGVSRRQQISITVRSAHEDTTVTGLPEGELKQVLYNILLNALQASPPGSEIAIRVDLTDDQVAIHVCDQGTGISPSHLRKIFDPFFTTKHGTQNSCMGLGLSVSQSLVQALGGSIEVQSTIGLGTTFTMRFPREHETTSSAIHHIGDLQEADHE